MYLLHHCEYFFYLYRTGRKAGIVERHLCSSIQFSLKADTGTVAGVAFKFPVHGIFLEYGVSCGHKRGNIRRSMSDWMCATLDTKE